MSLLLIMPSTTLHRVGTISPMKYMHSSVLLLCCDYVNIYLCIWDIYPYPSVLIHCHRNNRSIASVPENNMIGTWYSNRYVIIQTHEKENYLKHSSWIKPTMFHVEYSRFSQFWTSLMLFSVGWCQLISFYTKLVSLHHAGRHEHAKLTLVTLVTQVKTVYQRAWHSPSFSTMLRATHGNRLCF